MVKHGGALVKAPGMPGIPVPESLVVKVVAKFVTQRAENCAERRDLLADCGLHPDADEPGLGIIISEDLSGPATLAAAERPGREDSNLSPFHLVEISCDVQKLGTCLPDCCGCPRLKRRFKGYRWRPQAMVLWNVEDPVPVAFEEIGEQDRLAGFTVGEHTNIILDRDARATQAWSWCGWNAGLRPLLDRRRNRREDT